MRLTLQLLGLELDVTLGPVGSETSEFEAYQDAGVTGSTAQHVGFTPWEGPDVVHHFDPEPDGEDARRR